MKVERRRWYYWVPWDFVPRGTLISVARSSFGDETDLVAVVPEDLDETIVE